MQDKIATTATTRFLVMAQRAFAEARANLERARVLSEMGESYLVKAGAVDGNVPIEVMHPLNGFLTGKSAEEIWPLPETPAGHVRLSAKSAFPVRRRCAQLSRVRNRCL
jgi:hypothetical protein